MLWACTKRPAEEEPEPGDSADTHSMCTHAFTMCIFSSTLRKLEREKRPFKPHPYSHLSCASKVEIFKENPVNWWHEFLPWAFQRCTRYYLESQHLVTETRLPVSLEIEAMLCVWNEGLGLTLTALLHSAELTRVESCQNKRWTSLAL